MSELLTQFENRKSDHLQLALREVTQSHELNEFDLLQMIPDSLPDLDFHEIQTHTNIFQQEFSVPFFISSMTAGTEHGAKFNEDLARLSSEKNILMGIGSQRRELTDNQAQFEWINLRKKFPNCKIVANIGISQLIEFGADAVLKLIENSHAIGIFIHANALQECLQPEGTPRFKGGMRALEDLCRISSVPVILKEVGCGMSKNFIRRFLHSGVYAFDLGGTGGTHWGRIEGLRSRPESLQARSAETFKFWGVSTIQSMKNYSAVLEEIKFLQTQSEAESPVGNLPKMWASGGIRSGLDIAKSVAFGCEMVGMAQPWLLAWKQSGYSGLEQLFARLEMELRIAMFCSGAKLVCDLNQEKVVLHGN